MSAFSGARARIFVWVLACTCTVPMWGESQLGFRVLSYWPLRDARRLLWLAPCRPPVKTILIQHRLSKHTDCQAPHWSSDWWGKFKFKLEPDLDNFGVRLEGLPLPWPVTGSEGHRRLPVEYRDTISLYTDIAYDIVHDVVIRYPYIPILRAFLLRYRLVFFDIVDNIGWQGFWVWSVLISGYDIVYDIVVFLSIS